MWEKVISLTDWMWKSPHLSSCSMRIPNHSTSNEPNHSLVKMDISASVWTFLMQMVARITDTFNWRKGNKFYWTNLVWIWKVRENFLFVPCVFFSLSIYLRCSISFLIDTRIDVIQRLFTVKTTMYFSFSDKFKFNSNFSPFRSSDEYAFYGSLDLFDDSSFLKCFQ